MVEKILNSDLYASGANYMILGEEKQTLQLILMPGQQIVTKQQALLYASDNICSIKLKKNCCGRLCSYLPTIRSKAIDDKMNLQLKNDTSSIGYVGIQIMKGKVIVLDNKIDATKNMIVKNKYVMAHTHSVSLRACRAGGRIRRGGMDPDRNGEGQDGGLIDVWNNDPQLIGPDFIQMGNMMSQIESNHEE